MLRDENPFHLSLVHDTQQMPHRKISGTFGGNSRQTAARNPRQMSRQAALSGLHWVFYGQRADVLSD
jgi:hypothetical protein